jgi:hypothetical protein
VVVRPSRLRSVAVLAATMAVVVGFMAGRATRDTSPSRRNIDTSAFVAFPGSTTVKDFFERADAGRYIDTGSYSHPTWLIRRYRLASPVPRTEFDRWRDATWPQPGWQVGAHVDANLTRYARTVGRRHHFLDVYTVGGPGSATVSEYGITYAVT